VGLRAVVMAERSCAPFNRGISWLVVNRGEAAAALAQDFDVGNY